MEYCQRLFQNKPRQQKQMRVNPLMSFLKEKERQRNNNKQERANKMTVKNTLYVHGWNINRQVVYERSLENEKMV